MNRILRKIIAAFNYDSIEDPVFFMQLGASEEKLFDTFKPLLNEEKSPKDSSLYSDKKDNTERILWIANKYNDVVKKLYSLCKTYGMRRNNILTAKSLMNRYDNYINGLKNVNISELTDIAQKAYELLPLYQAFNEAVSDRPSEMGLGGLDVLDDAFCKGINKHYGQATLILNLESAKKDFNKQKLEGTTQAKDFKDFIRQFEIVSSNNANTSDKRDKGGKNVNRGYTR